MCYYSIMARTRKRKERKLTARLGPEVVALFTRAAGPMAHKLSKRRKTRDKARRIREIMKEY